MPEPEGEGATDHIELMNEQHQRSCERIAALDRDTSTASAQRKRWLKSLEEEQDENTDDQLQWAAFWSGLKLNDAPQDRIDFADYWPSN